MNVMQMTSCKETQGAMRSNFGKVTSLRATPPKKRERGRALGQRNQKTGYREGGTVNLMNRDLGCPNLTSNRRREAAAARNRSEPKGDHRGFYPVAEPRNTK